jgi:SSS family solute:Na+ symporter/sodium/proline symporter
MGPFVSFFGPDALNLLGVVILTSLGVWGLPQMVQKFYAIKSGPAIKQGAVISTLFAFVVAGGSYFMGGFGRLYAGEIEYSASGTPIYDSVIPTMLSSLPDVLIGLIIVLVLSASMSTLSSLVLTSSSTLTIDFIKGNIVKDMSEKKQLITMRVLLVVFVVISAVIALVQYHSSIVFIAQMMGYSWGALAGSFIGPFLWGLYKRKVSKASVWCSFIFGAGLTFVNMIMGFVGTPLIASSINCGAICMIASLIIVPVVSLFTPAEDFEIDPPSRKSAGDVAYEESVEGEGVPTVDSAAMQDVLDTVKSS